MAKRINRSSAWPHHLSELPTEGGHPPAKAGGSPRRGDQRQVVGWIQQAGLLTAIPCVLLVGPVLGYYLGTALDHRWSYAPWGMGIGIILGFVSSARVTAQLIRQAQEFNQQK